MSRPRLTPEHLAAHQAITMALRAADNHRDDPALSLKCINYAAKIIDRLRLELDLVDRTTDRAWRD